MFIKMKFELKKKRFSFILVGAVDEFYMYMEIVKYR